jgi:hypothetical protein
LVYESDQRLIHDAAFLTLCGKHAPRTSGSITNQAAHPALRRLIIEGNDGVLRALRVQEFNAQ